MLTPQLLGHLGQPATQLEVGNPWEGARRVQCLLADGGHLVLLLHSARYYPGAYPVSADADNTGYAPGR